VVGAIFGAAVSLFVVAVASDYTEHIEPLFPGVRSPVGEAVLAFAATAVAIFVIFGVAPVLLKKLASPRKPNGDA
jgi:glycerol uptake facilitator-like aquaporin